MDNTSHPITLYWNIASQPSRAVESILLAGDVPHNIVNIDIMKGEQHGEAFAKLNPHKMVPFIKDNRDGDDYGLSESSAILKYLCNTIDSIPTHYWPTDDQQRALTD